MRERLIAAVLLAAVLAGCTNDAPEAIRFGLSTPPVTLDPRFATDATSYRIVRLIYAALVDFDARQRPVPALAEWTAVTPLRYRFTLRGEHRFHDGSVLDGEDVAATYRSVLARSTQSPHRASLANIRDISVPSAQVVEFELHEPDPLFPGLLVIGILPAEKARADADGLPVGSGPFEVVERAGEDSLVLRRRADGQLVEFLTIRDATVRALKIVHGEIDVMQGAIGPELVQWLAARDGIVAHNRPGTTFTYLGFNLADATTRDASIRRAIAHAIDREALARYLFGGGARLAEAIFPPAHWAGNPALEPIAYDPIEAQALLARLGYDRTHPLPLTYKTSSDYFRLRVATVIQDQLARVGIDVTISSYDWGTFYADIKAGRFQMYSLSWVGLKQPDIFRYAFHSESVPPDGANRGRYTSAVVDGLIAEAERAHDMDARTLLYQRIQQVLHEDLPYVPLWYEDNIVVHRESILGYDTNIDGNYDALIHARRAPLP